MRKRNLFLTILISVAFASCQEVTDRDGKNADQISSQDSLFAAQNSILNYFNNSEADSILVNAVVFIGRKPAAATSETKFNPEFRSYYKDYSTGFSFYLYQITSDSIHYFYLIRPARGLDGTKRGVIGKFRVRPDYSLFEFEEIANTGIKSDRDLKKAGLLLFREILQSGNIDAFLNDTALIEWPDDRLKYCKKRNEWRYDVEE